MVLPLIDYKEIDCAWAHLSCLLWNDKVYIHKELQNDDFFGLEDLSLNYYCSKCDLCGKSNYGPTIKCAADNCEFKAHPECARINNYSLRVEEIDGESKFKLYCYDHQPIFLEKIKEKQKYIEQKYIEEFDNNLIKLFDSYKRKHKQNITEIDLKLLDDSHDKRDKSEQPKKNLTFSKQTTPKKYFRKSLSKTKNKSKSFNINNHIINENTNQYIKNRKNNSYKNISKFNERLDINDEPNKYREQLYLNNFIGFCNNFLKTNRVILNKNSENYKLAESNKIFLFDILTYKDFFNKTIPYDDNISYSLSKSKSIWLFNNYFQNEEEFKKKLNKEYVNKVIEIQEKNKEYQNEKFYCIDCKTEFELSKLPLYFWDCNLGKNINEFRNKFICELCRNGKKKVCTK